MHDDIFAATSYFWFKTINVGYDKMNGLISIKY